jgi:formylglycine-generating enzyme required for sulfatase activity
VERLHRRRISRSYAIAGKEVTVQQFRKFYQSFFSKDYENYSKEYSPTPDCPANAVSWYEAAAYCNWLSQQEGIDKDQWCYEPNGRGQYAEGMRAKPNYLRLKGYRLPSEAEWEYACRAGAVTSRYYGETEELLGRYAWYTTNSRNRGMLPGVPGALGVRGDCLKPNDFGLFDMLGNGLEWCQEVIVYYPTVTGIKAIEYIEYENDVKDRLSRVLRGGAFNNRPVVVRSALRNRSAPTNHLINVGFRPARTFTTE